MKTQQDTVLALLEFIENFATEMYEINSAELQNSPHDLEVLAKTIENIFDRKGGRCIVFTSVHKKQSN